MQCSSDAGAGSHRARIDGLDTDSSVALLTEGTRAALTVSAADVKIGFGHSATMATPQGRSPAGTVATTVIDSVSTTLTSFDGPFAV